MGRRGVLTLNKEEPDDGGGGDMRIRRRRGIDDVGVRLKVPRRSLTSSLSVERVLEIRFAFQRSDYRPVRVDVDVDGNASSSSSSLYCTYSIPKHATDTDRDRDTDADADSALTTQTDIMMVDGMLPLHPRIPQNRTAWSFHCNQNKDDHYYDYDPSLVDRAISWSRQVHSYKQKEGMPVRAVHLMLLLVMIMVV